MTFLERLGTTPVGNYRAARAARFSRWVLLFIPLAAVELRLGGHYFTLVDFFMVAVSTWQIILFLFGDGAWKMSQGAVFYGLLFGVYLGLIGLSFIYAPDKAGVFKEFGKWLEIFLVSCGVCLYVKGPREFANMYWGIFFFILGQGLGHIVGDIAAGHIFKRLFISIDFAVILALPFITSSWVRGTLFIVLAPLLILTYSRISWTSVALATLVLGAVVRGGGIPKRKILIAIIATVFAFGIVVLVTPRFQKIVEHRVMVTFIPTQDQSAFTRGAMDYAALEDVAEHPLHGVGAGNFKAHVLLAQENINFWLEPKNLPNSPHDALLQAAAELGVPGFLALTTVLALVIFGVMRTYRRTRLDPIFRQYSVGLVLFLISMAATFLASNIGETNRVLWGIYFGLALTGLRKISPLQNRDGLG